MEVPTSGVLSHLVSAEKPPPLKKYPIRGMRTTAIRSIFFTYLFHLWIPMRIRYYPSSLSSYEQCLMSLILDVEIGVQKWCITVRSRLLCEEICLGTQ